MHYATRSNLFIVIAFILMLIWTLITGHVVSASDAGWLPWAALTSYFLAGIAAV
jgi:hypothetical protein